MIDARDFDLLALDQCSLSNVLTCRFFRHPEPAKDLARQRALAPQTLARQTAKPVVPIFQNAAYASTAGLMNAIRMTDRLVAPAPFYRAKPAS